MPEISTTRSPAETSAQRGDALALAQGLNAARAVATLLVLVAHAGIAYMTTPVRSAMWLVHDRSHNIFVDVLLCFVNALAMPLFFLMAGMSAGAACAHSSPGEFVSKRLQRLGLPLLLGCFSVVPVCYILWGLGLLYSERVPMAQIYRLTFPAEMRASAIGPFHLWFLEYLLILSFAWCLIAWCAGRLGWSTKSPSLARWIGHPWGFALLTCIVLLVDLDSAYRLNNSFLPDVQRLCHYMVFFAAGALIIRLPQPTEVLKKYSSGYAILSLVIFIGLLPTMLAHVVAPLSGLPRLGLAVWQSLLVWCAMFGGLGLCIRCFGHRNAVMRYLSESSFWTYLIHLPIIALVQLVLWQFHWNVWVKLTLASAAGLGLSLLTYEWCVRYSWLGALVNGGRKKLKGVSNWRKEIGWVSVVVGTIICGAAFLWTNRDGIWGPHLEAVLPGEVYRSYRLNGQRLEAALAEHHIRTIINLAGGNPLDGWLIEQQMIASNHGAQVETIYFQEDEIPSSRQLIRLAYLLKDSPRPILLQGHRTPTLGGLGSAVALILEDDKDPAEALQQFSWKHFQVEGPEHCIVASPIRDYNAWIAKQTKPHSGRIFFYWANRIHRSPLELQQQETEETALQARLGAPRYNVRLR